MARRTLTAYALEFYRKRHPEQTFAPSDLDGADLLDAFEAWCRNLGPDDLHDPDRNRWVRVSDTRRVGRSLLVDVEVGSWGEAGALRDAQSGTVVTAITEDQAPTGMTRALLHVPTPGETALYFCEYSGRGSGGTILLTNFATHWSHSSDFTMKRNAVTEGEVWAESAELREVEVRVREHSSDLADPTSETLAILSHVLRPPRRHFLRRDLLDELRAHPERAARSVGLSDMPQRSEVLVTLRTSEGRQKKFVLGDGDDLPSMREELNGPGEPPLSDEVFVSRCEEKAADLLDRL